MNKEAFYRSAHDSMKKECDRLIEYTAALDADPAKKKENIAEYKCAKYRYAGVSAAHAQLYNCYMLGHKWVSSCYLTPGVYEKIGDDEELKLAYGAAHDVDKQTVGLYYGIKAFIRMLRDERSSKLSAANDWERIELNCYIEGYDFAEKCLTDAWVQFGGEA